MLEQLLKKAKIGVATGALALIGYGCSTTKTNYPLLEKRTHPSVYCTPLDDNQEICSARTYPVLK